MKAEERHIDEIYLELLSTGSEDGVKIIFERYYDVLCLYAESIIRDHGAAKEIVEDIFITIMRYAEVLLLDNISSMNHSSYTSHNINSLLKLNS